MNVGSEQWLSLLETGAAQLQLNLLPDQSAQFIRYAQLLLKWNQKINLTAITDPAEIVIKHFLDSLAPSAHIPSRGHLLDIGSGGGFPGLPLKILRPHQPMVLIDSVRKKTNFIKTVIRELTLDAVEAAHVRAEEMIQDPLPRRFDVIVSRAVAEVDTIARLAAPLLKPDGRVVVYKGLLADSKEVSERIVRIAEIRFARTIHSFRLPHSGDQRNLIILKPCASTGYGANG